MKYIAQVTFCLALALQPAAAAQPQEKLSVDQAFEQLKSYEYGQSDKALRVIELYVGRFATDAAHKDQVAERLAAILADAKTPQAAKVFICQQLLVVGTEAQVRLLAKMLDDPQTAEIARYTLEAIPGEASLEAIRGGLGRLKGKPLVGAINSLGIRRDAKAVEALTKLLEDPDPQVAAAAAESLGKIGTPEAAAALVKAEVPAKAGIALHNARLQCAERLAAARNAATAAALYEHLWSSSRPAERRIAGLIGLAKVAPDKAAPLVLAALSSADPLLQAKAVRLAGQLPGPQVTAALVGRLDGLDATGQALLLGALAERGDRSAAEAAARRMDHKEEAVRVAAIRAMAKLGNAATVDRLAQLAATAGGATQQAARASLAGLVGADVEAKLLAMAAQGEPAMQIEVLRALAARRTAGAAPVLLKAATDADLQIRLAALESLGAVAQADSYPRLVGLLVSAATPAEAAVAQRAVLAVGGSLATADQRLGPVLAALKSAPAGVRPALLQILAGFGDPGALAAVRARLDDAEEAVADAAVRALAGWPDASAAADLLKVAQTAKHPAQRTLAVRGYLRLAGAVKDPAARLKMLQQVRPIATTAPAKQALLAVLAEAADPGALVVAAGFLDDAAVRAEAEAAALKLGRTLARVDPPAVRAAMKKLMDTTKDKALAEQAAAIDEEALKAPSPEAVQQALQHDAKRSDVQKAALAKRAPKGYRLACYLDCGPDAADGVRGGPLLHVVAGSAHFWPESDRAADIRFGTIWFDSQRIVFEAAGLNPKKSYQVGFTWWDFDHNTRAQSVLLATGKGDREITALGKTQLPSGPNKEPPGEKTLPVPPDLYTDGSLRIGFRNETGPNAVVSELWLWESEAEGQAAAAPAGGKPNVLLVTGQELHDWKATAPVVVELLQKDPRLRVRVVENPSFLADPSIHQYDAIVLHFMNYQVPSPGKEARENFRKYVASGKGVFMIHFACGAWQDWPEFREIVGRVWDPKLRPHDPRGPFRVTMTEVKHPITRGLKPFQADDELYTCLAGEKPVEVLAVARSIVDKKDYPMALVCPYGKGRVFQCLLGHDVKAMKMPGVGELYRRGCAWAAGLAPSGQPTRAESLPNK